MNEYRMQRDGFITKVIGTTITAESVEEAAEIAEAIGWIVISASEEYKVLTVE